MYANRQYHSLYIIDVFGASAHGRGEGVTPPKNPQTLVQLEFARGGQVTG